MNETRRGTLLKYWSPGDLGALQKGYNGLNQD